MDSKSCCGSQTDSDNSKEYEIIKLEKINFACGLCEGFTTAKMANKNLVAVLSCEGACLRGDVSRRVANNICFEEFPENTARVCLGGAFTKDTGQRNMVRNADRVVALEGCGVECASRMMKGVIPGLKTEVILVDDYYDFDRSLFAINDTSEDELNKFAIEATANIKNLKNFISLKE